MAEIPAQEGAARSPVLPWVGNLGTVGEAKSAIPARGLEKPDDPIASTDVVELAGLGSETATKKEVAGGQLAEA